MLRVVAQLIFLGDGSLLHVLVTSLLLRGLVALHTLHVVKRGLGWLALAILAIGETLHHGLLLQLSLGFLLERIDVEGQLRSIEEQGVVVGLDVLELLFICGGGLIDDGLDAFLELLHDILVFELIDIVLFSLYVSIEQRTFLN